MILFKKEREKGKKPKYYQEKKKKKKKYIYIYIYSFPFAYIKQLILDVDLEILSMKNGWAINHLDLAFICFMMSDSNAISFSWSVFFGDK